MAFLFKSKKSHDRALAGREGNSGSQGSIQSNGARMTRDEKSMTQHRATPTGSVNSIDNDGSLGSPEHGHGRRGGSVDKTVSDLPFRNGPQQMSNPAASLYPWSQRRLTYTTNQPSPFPRYGAAVNSLSSKEGDIYMMGGLIKSSTVRGDLWMIEAGGNMACYPLATTAEGPGPRVGHSSLLVGNAFIVYGGDTKIEDTDSLDETLYLLNTSTRQWSRALPAGPRPSGRYGHTLNILGSKIYIFGGQVDGLFMNDLCAFDLNQLQLPNNRWEVLFSGDSAARMPAARTNHTIITYNDKMYLFGGTNGFTWYNDVWCYDPLPNTWTQLDCIGYIPAPREGHAAAVVDDVMYVFGGRTDEGVDLGDLAAFRITSRRWYTFQNMGPSPSPRSGHSMTTVGKSVVVMGGEPSSASSTVNDLGILYLLDTSKIRYPNDNQPSGVTKSSSGSRRPSESGITSRQASSREGSLGPESRRLASAAGTAPLTNGHKSPPNGVDANSPSAPQGPSAGSRLPRATGAGSPSGSASSGPTANKPTTDPGTAGRVRGVSSDRNGPSGSPQIGISAVTREVIPESESETLADEKAASAQPAAKPVPALTSSDSTRSKHRHQRNQGSVDAAADAQAKALANRPASPPAPIRQLSNAVNRRSSGRNSQTVTLLKELDSSRTRNAWYASELELARKAGYVSSASMGPILDSKSKETFDDEDRPLIEALLAMRTELANVQSAVDKQAILAAKQVAEAEKQRDAAIQEALYAKARAAAQTGSSATSTPQMDGARDEPSGRADDMGRKLATALHSQKDLQSKLEALRAELESEKRARQMADDTTTAAQKRLAGLESYKQNTSTEVERLKAELHVAQRSAREHSVASSEAIAALELLRVEKEEVSSKYDDMIGSNKDQDTTFESLRSAIEASQDAQNHLQAKLEEERAQRMMVEDKLVTLKSEHEARTSELVATTQRLRDAEELVEKHANEARTHREAVVAGLNKLTARDTPRSGSANTERVAALQSQIASSNALVKKYQQEVDAAADKLRSAEERIAGLEQYQEQSSREGVTIRRQLQAALREIQGLQTLNAELKNQLASQQLDANALLVQHNALKDILSERGISPTTAAAAARAKGLPSPQLSSHDQNQIRELEAQLANAHTANEEAKQAFAAQAQESETAYREKLSQLESDYQSAVHYVKGTEKMLKQLTDQLTRLKSDNGRLKSEIVDLEDRLNEREDSAEAPSDWEEERIELIQKVETLEAELQTSGDELQRHLDALRAERDAAIQNSDDTSKRLQTQRKDLEQLQSENALLEQRASDAEQKVSLLLDQVEHSVDNYRRQSRQTTALTPGGQPGPNGHVRQESSEGESLYGGNNGPDDRDSLALDNLASELEAFRSRWETTNKNYRMSTNFDFDTPTSGRKPDEGGAGVGLSESLADWRKKLDSDDAQSDPEKTPRP